MWLVAPLLPQALLFALLSSSAAKRDWVSDHHEHLQPLGSMWEETHSEANLSKQVN